MSKSKWKSPFVNINLLRKLKNNNNKNIYTKSRSSTILENFVGWTIFVHQGIKYTKVNITSNMVGFKLGEFSFTRKIGKIHTSKDKKK